MSLRSGNPYDGVQIPRHCGGGTTAVRGATLDFGKGATLSSAGLRAAIQHDESQRRFGPGGKAIKPKTAFQQSSAEAGGFLPASRASSSSRVATIIQQQRARQQSEQRLIQPNLEPGQHHHRSDQNHPHLDSHQDPQHDSEQREYSPPQIVEGTDDAHGFVEHGPSDEHHGAPAPAATALSATAVASSGPSSGRVRLVVVESPKPTRGRGSPPTSSPDHHHDNDPRSSANDAPRVVAVDPSVATVDTAAAAATTGEDRQVAVHARTQGKGLRKQHREKSPPKTHQGDQHQQVDRSPEGHAAVELAAPLPSFSSFVSAHYPPPPEGNTSSFRQGPAGHDLFGPGGGGQGGKSIGGSKTLRASQRRPLSADAARRPRGGGWRGASKPNLSRGTGGGIDGAPPVSTEGKNQAQIAQEHRHVKATFGAAVGSVHTAARVAFDVAAEERAQRLAEKQKNDAPYTDADERVASAEFYDATGAVPAQGSTSAATWNRQRSAGNNSRPTSPSGEDQEQQQQQRVMKLRQHHPKNQRPFSAGSRIGVAKVTGRSDFVQSPSDDGTGGRGGSCLNPTSGFGPGNGGGLPRSAAGPAGHHPSHRNKRGGAEEAMSDEAVARRVRAMKRAASPDQMYGGQRTGYFMYERRAIRIPGAAPPPGLDKPSGPSQPSGTGSGSAGAAAAAAQAESGGGVGMTGSSVPLHAQNSTPNRGANAARGRGQQPHHQQMAQSQEQSDQEPSKKTHLTLQEARARYGLAHTPSLGAEDENYDWGSVGGGRGRGATAGSVSAHGNRDQPTGDQAAAPSTAAPASTLQEDQKEVGDSGRSGSPSTLTKAKDGAPSAPDPTAVKTTPTRLQTSHSNAHPRGTAVAHRGDDGAAVEGEEQNEGIWTQPRVGVLGSTTPVPARREHHMTTCTVAFTDAEMAAASSSPSHPSSGGHHTKMTDHAPHFGAEDSKGRGSPMRGWSPTPHDKPSSAPSAAHATVGTKGSTGGRGSAHHGVVRPSALANHPSGPGGRGGGGKGSTIGRGRGGASTATIQPPRSVDRREPWLQLSASKKLSERPSTPPHDQHDSPSKSAHQTPGEANERKTSATVTGTPEKTLTDEKKQQIVADTERGDAEGAVMAVGTAEVQRTPRGSVPMPPPRMTPATTVSAALRPATAPAARPTKTTHGSRGDNDDDGGVEEHDGDAGSPSPGLDPDGASAAMSTRGLVGKKVGPSAYGGAASKGGASAAGKADTDALSDVVEDDDGTDDGFDDSDARWQHHVKPQRGRSDALAKFEEDVSGGHGSGEQPSPGPTAPEHRSVKIHVDGDDENGEDEPIVTSRSASATSQRSRPQSASGSRRPMSASSGRPPGVPRSRPTSASLSSRPTSAAMHRRSTSPPPALGSPQLSSGYHPLVEDDTPVGADAALTAAGTTGTNQGATSSQAGSGQAVSSGRRVVIRDIPEQFVEDEIIDEDDDDGSASDIVIPARAAHPYAAEIQRQQQQKDLRSQARTQPTNGGRSDNEHNERSQEQTEARRPLQASMPSDGLDVELSPQSSMGSPYSHRPNPRGGSTSAPRVGSSLPEHGAVKSSASPPHVLMSSSSSSSRSPNDELSPTDAASPENPSGARTQEPSPRGQEKGDAVGHAAGSEAASGSASAVTFIDSAHHDESSGLTHGSLGGDGVEGRAGGSRDGVGAVGSAELRHRPWSASAAGNRSARGVRFTTEIEERQREAQRSSQCRSDNAPIAAAGAGGHDALRIAAQYDRAKQNTATSGPGQTGGGDGQSSSGGTTSGIAERAKGIVSAAMKSARSSAANAQAPGHGQKAGSQNRGPAITHGRDAKGRFAFGYVTRPARGAAPHHTSQQKSSAGYQSRTALKPGQNPQHTSSAAARPATTSPMSEHVDNSRDAETDDGRTEDPRADGASARGATREEDGAAAAQDYDGFAAAAGGVDASGDDGHYGGESSFQPMNRSEGSRTPHWSRPTSASTQRSAATPVHRNDGRSSPGRVRLNAEHRRRAEAVMRAEDDEADVFQKDHRRYDPKTMLKRGARVAASAHDREFDAKQQELMWAEVKHAALAQKTEELKLKLSHLDRGLDLYKYSGSRPGSASRARDTSTTSSRQATGAAPKNDLSAGPANQMKTNTPSSHVVPSSALGAVASNAGGGGSGLMPGQPRRPLSAGARAVHHVEVSAAMLPSFPHRQFDSSFRSAFCDQPGAGLREGHGVHGQEEVGAAASGTHRAVTSKYPAPKKKLAPTCPVTRSGTNDDNPQGSTSAAAVAASTGVMPSPRFVGVQEEGRDDQQREGIHAASQKKASDGDGGHGGADEVDIEDEEALLKHYGVEMAAPYAAGSAHRAIHAAAALQPRPTGAPGSFVSMSSASSLGGGESRGVGRAAAVAAAVGRQVHSVRTDETPGGVGFAFQQRRQRPQSAPFRRM